MKCKAEMQSTVDELGGRAESEEKAKMAAMWRRCKARLPKPGFTACGTACGWVQLGSMMAVDGGEAA
ncbi:hypothetical protein AB6D20_027935 (plasmid) [Vibrio splendidus]